MAAKKAKKGLGGVRTVAQRPLPGLVDEARKGKPSTSTVSPVASLTGYRRRTKRKRAGLPSWEDLHQRITFHCPRDLAELLDEAADTGTRSKSEIIVAALRRELEQPA